MKIKINGISSQESSCKEKYKNKIEEVTFQLGNYFNFKYVEILNREGNYSKRLISEKIIKLRKKVVNKKKKTDTDVLSQIYLKL